MIKLYDVACGVEGVTYRIENLFLSNFQELALDTNCKIECDEDSN